MKKEKNEALGPDPTTELGMREIIRNTYRNLLEKLTEPGTENGYNPDGTLPDDNPVAKLHKAAHNFYKAPDGSPEQTQYYQDMLKVLQPAGLVGLTDDQMKQIAIGIGDIVTQGDIRAAAPYAVADPPPPGEKRAMAGKLVY